MCQPREDVFIVHPPGVVRDLYASAIEEAGFSAAVSDNVEIALQRVEQGTLPATLVMELLPEPSGAWLLIERTRSLQSEVSIVIVTSLIRPDGANRRKARGLGCAAFVAKPCALSQLTDAVTRVRRGERGLEIVSG